MRNILILQILICFCMGSLWSQHGKIIGTVTDKEGNPQENVTVTIVSVQSSARKVEVKTNKDGRFSQIGLWPDYYNVTFKKSGFMPFSREIRVRIAAPTELEVILDTAQDMMERNLSQADKLFLEGNKLYAEQKYDEAIEFYNKALEISQSQWGYYFNLGLAHKKTEQKEDAIAAFKKALEINPESYSINKELGQLLALEENYEEAKNYYAKASEISDDDPEAFYNLGVCLANLGDQKGALAAFLKAIEFKEDYADAYYQIGTLYINQNNVEAAIKNLEKFLELAPEHEKAPVSKQLLDYLKK